MTKLPSKWVTPECWLRFLQVVRNFVFTVDPVSCRFFSCYVGFKITSKTLDVDGCGSTAGLGG